MAPPASKDDLEGGMEIVPLHAERIVSAVSAVAVEEGLVNGSKSALLGGGGAGAEAPVTTLEWNVESFTVGKGEKAKTIIRGVAGKTESGQLTALLGPSGCGKTTLIQALSLRNRNFEGGIRLNGKAPGGDYLITTALVHQTQLLFGFMTPREHLTFQAIARMSRAYTKEQITGRVEEVIREAQLQKCADTLIGGTDLLFLKRGISGGERKRVDIATELLRCPNVILLDEPTSGLDSVMAEIVLSILSQLAKRGRIVLTCVHSPSSELMGYFTHLLLLTHEGTLAYHGPRVSAVPFFETLGYKYPLDFNSADYLLRIMSCPYSGEEEVDMAGEAKRLDVITKAYQASDYAIVDPLPILNEHKELQRIQGRGASDWTLLKINGWRYFLLFKRDMLTLTLWVGSNAIVGLLLGVLFFNQAPKNWRNLMGMVFSLAVSGLLVGVLGNLVRFPLEWAPFTREYFAGTNAIGPYFLSRYVLIAPYVAGPAVLSVTVYWMTGMVPSVWQFLAFTGILCSSILCSMSLGQLASCMSHNILVGLAITPSFVTPMVLFSGLLYQRGTVPAWLSWIEKVSIMNYTFSALIIQQAPALTDHTGPVMLKFLEISPKDYNHDIMMLWVLFGAFSIVTYIILSLRMRFATDIA